MFAIFDSRHQHSAKPFLFATEGGMYCPAVYSTKEKAEEIAAKMNAITTLTTYVVKGVKWTAFNAYCCSVNERH